MTYIYIYSAMADGTAAEEQTTEKTVDAVRKDTQDIQWMSFV